LSYGVFGKYADIDLSTGNVSQYEIPREWFDSYLGGRGIGARLLLNKLEKEVSPLEPENIRLRHRSIPRDRDRGSESECCARGLSRNGKRQ